MITMETAERIWTCHREMIVAEKLMEEIGQDKKERWYDESAGRLRDAFGQRRDFQLGVPSGDNGHRLFNVSPPLAVSVIRAHIEHKKAELAEANEQARIELDSEKFKVEPYGDL